MGDLNSANRYVYAGDDPVNAVDPSGAFCIPHALLAAGLALGFLSLLAFALIPFGGPLILLTIIGIVAFAGGGVDTFLDVLPSDNGHSTVCF